MSKQLSSSVRLRASHLGQHKGCFEAQHAVHVPLQCFPAMGRGLAGQGEALGVPGPAGAPGPCTMETHRQPPRHLAVLSHLRGSSIPLAVLAHAVLSGCLHCRNSLKSDYFHRRHHKTSWQSECCFSSRFSFPQDIETRVTWHSTAGNQMPASFRQASRHGCQTGSAMAQRLQWNCRCCGC